MDKKWTNETINKAIYDLVETLGIDRMPTRQEMKENNFIGLYEAVSRTGGINRRADDLQLGRIRTFWDNERIEKLIKESMKSLQIKRMPTASELKALNKSDLHSAISRSELKYSGWASKLNLELKSSETKMGNEYEYIVKEKIESLFSELNVEKMTTGHPYDLLINGCVKVDVKVSSPHLVRESSRVHTFGLNKECATCDIYICVALNEEEEIERTFIIPSPHVKMVTLCVGRNSKYNKYVDKWNFIYDFTRIYENAISY